MRLTGLALAALALLAPLPSNAEAPAQAKKPDLAASVPPHPLPPPVTTEHELKLPGRTLHVTATVGAVRLSDAGSGQPVADIGYKAYRIAPEKGAGPRPLAIALNGGPGASSAWLDLGAIGPWRLPVDTSGISPSAATSVVDNAETWLDFTDLLFIDPLGTGYSRALGKGDETKSFFSVKGDIDYLATVIRKWLVANDRLSGPKFIVGESYGGFRAPRLAKKLEQGEGVGVDGIIMVSPVLDFAWFSSDDNPAVWAGHLPSLVAAAKKIKGPDPRSKLGAAEMYASGPYLVDLYRGLRDEAARHRMAGSVAGLTGLDKAFVERLGGRVDADAMTREMNRQAGKIASPYDTNITGFDPNPFDADGGHHSDPVLDALRAPMTSAMAQITADRLKWPINARYELLSMSVNGKWDWDNGRQPTESMGDLSALLSLDPHFRALVMHGVTDQVTPYFTSKMLIDQIPAYGDASRLRLAVYGGGHMLYFDDEPRAAMREDARKLITGEPAMGQR